MGFKDFVPAEMHGQVAATPETAGSSADLFELDGDAASSGEELDRELSAALGETPQPSPALPKARRRRAAPSTATLASPPFASERPPDTVATLLQRPALSQAMVAVLILLLVANVLTLVAGWKSQADVGGLLQKIGARTAGEVETSGQQAIGTSRSNPGNQALAARPEGFETLDLAQRAIDQGDYGRARRELFALQAVGDRLDTSVRDDVLARAAFMIADAYRRQAESMAATPVPEERP